MGNLGYFQLKAAAPGAWRLSLAPAGGGGNTSAYAITSIEGAGAGVGTVTADGDVAVVVDSLDGARGTLLRVRHRAEAGGDAAAVGDGGGGGGGVRDKLSSLFRRGAPSPTASATAAAGASVDGAADGAPAHDPRIHVFSVASGHLYERLLKIMMLSVVRHAGAPVKFWLLQNTLSPAFKALLPGFAAAHGFEVGLVTFRWPTWLRAQTDAQRTIWAYKILFLDVLFPLTLRRVIFVDSDQVVRADLAELMALPLDGAPYGYVPFCESRRDVDGFRFWKGGYWAGILAGRPYHISALYVVDLDVFRSTRAGDTLRAVYQSLSADPASLSNLDQDLPNYAAVTPGGGAPGGHPLVRIFSLPQEWLWCDSWCDQASKPAAKTIDLCNNPLTKVPKLVAAKTIIPEWEEYDRMAAATTAEVYARLAQAVASGGGGLGGEGGVPPPPPDEPLAVPEPAVADGGAAAGVGDGVSRDEL
ncbi:hypothetical protein BU14_0488s0015 [Porphyra umbilicalis]|uniref:Glucosyltransferase 24 catalytic domain-containing protein n=1 Tax=Porphyra umbilicalis TaxID=2786 RepID=A0A1X6NU88_PORUM|nr:hypothetical protein BU14_0488s0015 [Porphyra umbilicalis]|eukprot:OSX71953.1 hypothetical protein BU14_0488s0015 [Porphyra umbilicalis]